jgi:hypothetical protein
MFSKNFDFFELVMSAEGIYYFLLRIKIISMISLLHLYDVALKVVSEGNVWKNEFLNGQELSR